MENDGSSEGPNHEFPLPPPNPTPLFPPAPGNGPVSRIHTEKYIPWKGTPHSRRQIVFHCVREGFRHNMGNKWVKSLVVLAWLFNVFLILLIAIYGGITLIQDTPEGQLHEDELWEMMSEYDTDFPYTAYIQQNETAYYNISVVNSGMHPDIVSITFGHVDEEWNVEFREPGSNESTWEMNLSITAGDMVTFQLLVTPPWHVASGQGRVDVHATSEGASFFASEVDYFWVEPERITTVTIVGQTAESPFHFTISTESYINSVPAGGEIGYSITINNTGTEHDIYALKVQGLPRDWEFRHEGVDYIDEPFYRGPGIALAPGENRTFTVYYSVPDDPFSINFIGVGAKSMNDPSLSKGTVNIVEVYDIPEKDMTAEVFAQPDEGRFGAIFLLFTLFLTAVVGSKAISQDLAHKSYTIYFSRPITKIDYILIKHGTVASTLSMVTIVPMLVVYLGLILLSDVDVEYVMDHLWVWGAIIAHSLIIIGVFTTLSLAFSSLTSRRFYAAFGLVVSYLITTIMASIIINDFNEKRGSVVSIYQSIQVVGAEIFDVPGISYDYDWRYNLLVLMVVMVISFLTVSLKIRRTELSE